jgi:hypothetical protein
MQGMRVRCQVAPAAGGRGDAAVRIAIAGILMAAFPVGLTGQETEPAATLPRGMLELQTSEVVNLEKYRGSSGGTRTAAFGNPQIRYGVLPRVELRAQGDGYLRRSVLGGAGTQGRSDWGFGAKVSLLEDGGRQPGLAIIPLISLPLGHRAFSSATVDPSLRVLVDKQLGSYWIGGNVWLAALSNDEGRYSWRSWSLAVDREVAQSLNWNGEIYRSARSRATPGVWLLNTGLTRVIAENAAIQVEVGRVLQQSCTAWAVSIGVVLQVNLSREARSGER